MSEKSILSAFMLLVALSKSFVRQKSVGSAPTSDHKKIKCLTMSIQTKIDNYRVLHLCFPTDDSPFLRQMAQERDTYLFSKLWVVAIKNSYDIGSKFVIRISRWVLAKVVGLSFLHWTLRTCHIWANWPKKELYTSLESPE